MKANSFRFKALTAIVLITALLLSALPALAESYSAVLEKGGTLYTDAKFTNKAGELDAGTVLTVTAVNGNVARVKYNGRSYYTDKEDLTSVEDMAIPARATVNTFVFESASTSAKYTSLKKGTEVNVLLTSGKWAYVEKNGKTGYALKSHLEAVAATDDGTDTDPFDTTPAQEEAQTVNGVTVETLNATVTASSLPVYKKASSSSKKLTTLKQGTAVVVYAYNKSWACITLPGSKNYGYCAVKGLEKGSAVKESSGTEADNAIPAVVVAKSATVYKKASTSSAKLGTIKKDQQVNVLKTSGSWAYIELDGKYGYCAIKALKKVTADTDGGEDLESEGTCTVIKASAKVYSSPDKSSSSVTVSIGTSFEYFKANSTWVAVDYNGTTAYMLKSDLSADVYAELSTEDSGTAVKALNTALLKLGYLDDTISTSFTGETEKAVKRLQSACGMTQTGVADTALLRVLHGGHAPESPILSTTLSNGKTGTNVTRLQTRLYALEYLSKESSIDGSYGSTTASAISLFQKACGGSATGTANPATIRALYSEKAPSLPESADAADDVTTPSGTDTGTGTTTTTTSMPSSLKSTTSSISSGANNAKKIEYVIYLAQKQLGKRYVFGSSGTATFDCSGLTMWCFKQVGISLPHSAKSQGYNEKVSKISSVSSLKRGDLVFFNTVSDSDRCDHVGIFLGKKNFLHASSGAGKVVVSNIGSGYYNRVFSWGRRYLPT